MATVSKWRAPQKLEELIIDQGQDTVILLIGENHHDHDQEQPDPQLHNQVTIEAMIDLMIRDLLLPDDYQGLQLIPLWQVGNTSSLKSIKILISSV